MTEPRDSSPESTAPRPAFRPGDRLTPEQAAALASLTALPAMTRRVRRAMTVAGTPDEYLDDVLQESVTAAYEAAREYMRSPRATDFRAHLRLKAANAALAEARRWAPNSRETLVPNPTGMLPGNRDGIEQVDTRLMLASLLHGLPERERIVLFLHIGLQLRLADAGSSLGIGVERARQIEAQAILKTKMWAAGTDKPRFPPRGPIRKSKQLDQLVAKWRDEARARSQREADARASRDVMPVASSGRQGTPTGRSRPPAPSPTPGTRRREAGGSPGQATGHRAVYESAAVPTARPGLRATFAQWSRNAPDFARSILHPTKRPTDPGTTARNPRPRG